MRSHNFLKTSTFFTFATLALLPALSAANAMPLEEAVHKTLQENPQVQQAENEQREVERSVREAQGGYLPQLDLTAATGQEHSDNATTNANFGEDEGLWRSEARLQMTQMLFDGWRVSSSVAQQRARYMAAGEQLSEVQQNITLAAVEAYLNVLRRQELLERAEQNVANHETYFNKISEQTEGGQASRADLRQSAGRLARAQSNLIDFRRQLQDARATYHEVVGVAPEGLNQPDFIPESEIPNSLEEALETAMRSNPAILAQQHNVVAAQKAVDESRASYMPRFDIEVSAGAGDNIDGSPGRNNEVLALVRMNYNLFAGGSDVARTESRAARRSAAKSGLYDLKRDIRARVVQAWNNYTNTASSLEHLGEYVVAAEQTRDAYIDQFDLGMRTQFDLLDSEIEAFNANVAYTNARYDYQIAKYEIRALLGNVTDAFQVAAR